MKKLVIAAVAAGVAMALLPVAGIAGAPTPPSPAPMPYPNPDLTPIPLPAALPLLAAAVGAVVLAARGKR